MAYFVCWTMSHRGKIYRKSTALLTATDHDTDIGNPFSI